MKAHGDIALEWNGNILIIHAKGPFNLEGILETDKRYKKYVLDAGVSPWLALDIWDDESLASPQGLTSVKDTYQWAADHGCTAAAIVVANGLQYAIVKKMKLSTIEVFHDKELAIAWLHDKQA